MKKCLFLFLFLTTTVSLFSQSTGRAGDCMSYQGDILTQSGFVTVQSLPSRDSIIVIPPSYEIVTETIQIAPATTTSDKDCLTCVVEVPAKFTTIKRKQIVTPSRVITIQLPALFDNIPIFTIKEQGRFVLTHGGECGTTIKG